VNERPGPRDPRVERLTRQAYLLADDWSPLWYDSLWKGILKALSGRRFEPSQVEALISVAEGDLAAVQEARKLVARRHPGPRAERAASLLEEVERQLRLNQ
jgi:hypothetical protein